MIVEFLKYLFTPCPPEARRLGLLSELIALEARSRRCAVAWAGHQAACKDLILAAALACPRSTAVLVAGSGLLLEIPLEELTQIFDRVLLCDVLHMPAVRQRAGRLKGVECITLDLTGLHRTVLSLARDPRAGEAQALELASPAPDWFLDRRDLGLVVSANILSQLPLAPLAALGKRFPRLGPEALEPLGRGIVEAHLSWLSRFEATVCLIADHARLYWTPTTCSTGPRCPGPAASGCGTWPPGPRPAATSTCGTGSWAWPTCAQPPATLHPPRETGPPSPDPGRPGLASLASCPCGRQPGKSPGSLYNIRFFFFHIDPAGPIV